MRGSKLRTLAVVAVAFALVGAACSKDKTGNGGTPTGNAGLTGDIVVSGSSTVEPISSLIAELFNEDNPDVNISVDGPGTGDGFALFCNDETDISDASRQIKDEEAQACADKGIEYVELEIGLDGITVMTNPANDAVDCLTTGDLYGLLGPESEGFDKWSDANALATEVGGKGGLPDADLAISAPGEESGTYDAFIELALKEIAATRVEAGKITEDQAATLRPDYPSSPNDNVIIQGIEGSDASLGFVGFAYAENNASGVKILGVDAGDGCVTPSRDTIADGSYPLSRSLYIYVNKAKITTNDALKAFVEFYVSDTGLVDSVKEAGYVELPSDRIDATRSTWDGAAA